MNTATDLLSKKHRQYLRDAGISDEIITGRGYVTIRPGRNPDSVRRNLKDEFGIWVQDARQLSGILIPLWGTQSYREPVSHVFRPDTPEIDSKGKPRKYVYPTGKPPVLDLHPVTRKRGVLGDRDTDLWITEGAKKADALASRGLAVIMISGVQMWRAGGEPLHDWDAVYLRGRTAYVCFDADASVNHNVARAMGDLGASLAHSGANVKYVVTPGDPKQKTGADDFFPLVARWTSWSQRPATILRRSTGCRLTCRRQRSTRSSQNTCGMSICGSMVSAGTGRIDSLAARLR